QSLVKDYRDSRLWRSLERIGVGAIPALPGNLNLLREWLLSVLQQGGWSMADQAIPSIANEQAREWQIAATEFVLVGVLRSPGSQEHLDWIRDERIYYLPYAKTQKRQLHAKQVAIYLPKGLNKRNGIHYIANVNHISVIERSEISTPWESKRRGPMVLYRLGDLHPMKRVVGVSKNDKTTIQQSRWTSRLAISRAKTLGEIALETEPEWRLLEWLQATAQNYSIKSQSTRKQDPDNPRGRAWFHLGSGEHVRFDGINGFLVKAPGCEDRYLSLEKLVNGGL
ncbi:MAG: hypothetical protein AAF497_06090, partial [Planctomycetota bacterium]